MEAAFHCHFDLMHSTNEPLPLTVQEITNNTLLLQLLEHRFAPRGNLSIQSDFSVGVLWRLASMSLRGSAFGSFFSLSQYWSAEQDLK